MKERKDCKYAKRAIELVLEHLIDSRQKDSSGRWHLQSLRHRMSLAETSSILLSVIEFNKEIESKDRDQIIHRSIFDAIQNDQLGYEVLFRSIGRIEEEYLSKPTKKYVLLSQISINAARLPFTRTKWGNSLIILGSDTDPKFGWGELERTITNLGLNKRKNRWAWVRVVTRGRSPTDAMEKSQRDLNEIRAVWNFWRNYRTRHRTESPVDTPVNELLLGPLQTIHECDGSVAGRVFCYQQPFVSAHDWPCSWKDEEWASCRKYERSIRRRMSQSSYYHEILSWAREYCICLDSVDLESRFIRLWNILEKLVGLSGQARYDDLIRRASFIWPDRTRARVTLEHLRDVRNNLVHDMRLHEDGNACLWQLLGFVHELFRFHIRNSDKIRSINEASYFLGLAPDVYELKRQIFLRRFALAHWFK